MKVYEVIFNWSTEDENNVETAIFSTYEKAKEYFERIIENENDADISWVGSEVFDENGDVNEGYELRCNTDTDEAGERNLYWHVSDANKYRFSIITLTKKEIL